MWRVIYPYNLMLSSHNLTCQLFCGQLPVFQSYAEAGRAGAGWGMCGRSAAVLLFVAPSAQKPRPPHIRAETSRQGWKPGLATASLPSEGREASPASGVWGGSSSVQKGALLSPRRLTVEAC